MQVSCDQIVLDSGIVRVDASVPKNEVLATVPECFVKIQLSRFVQPSKQILNDAYQKCQCKAVPGSKNISSSTAVAVDGDWFCVSYQEEQSSYDLSFQFKVPRVCSGPVDFTIFVTFTSCGNTLCEYSKVISPVIVAMPALYVEYSDTSRFLQFLLHNMFPENLVVNSISLAIDEVSQSVSDEAIGLPENVGADSSLCWCTDINEMDILLKRIIDAKSNSASLVSLNCFVDWTLPTIGFSYRSIHMLPLFEAFTLRLIVFPKVLSQPPHCVNEPLLVRYQVVNKIGDFRGLTVKWNGPSSLYCLNPEEKLGSLIKHSESECCMEFVPTQPGVFNLGGDSLRLELQFSSVVLNKFHMEEVFKSSLFVHVVEKELAEHESNRI